MSDVRLVVMTTDVVNTIVALDAGNVNNLDTESNRLPQSLLLVAPPPVKRPFYKQEDN